MHSPDVIRPKHAPRCWGISIAYDSSAKFCNQCAYENGCASECGRALQIIHQQTDVSDFLEQIKQCGIEIEIDQSPNVAPRQHKARKPKRKRTKTISTHCLISMYGIPKKSKEIVTQIARMGIDLKHEIRNNRNPFCGERPVFLEGVCAALLMGKFTREDMINHIQKMRPNWQKDTVRSHYNAAIQALIALEIIEECHDQFEVLN
ncbi:MAG: hypothetical protein ABJG42_24465 [Vibrio splendidus]